MKAPEKIYLQVCGDCKDNDCENCKFEDLEYNVTWCKDEIFDKDIEYTRTDAFIEKAARYLNCRLYNRVEVVNFGTVLESIMSKGEFVDEFRKYMKGE